MGKCITVAPACQRPRAAPFTDRSPTGGCLPQSDGNVFPQSVPIRGLVLA